MRQGVFEIGQRMKNKAIQWQPRIAGEPQGTLQRAPVLLPLRIMANWKRKRSRGEPVRRGGDEFHERGRGADDRACGLRRRPAGCAKHE